MATVVKTLPMTVDALVGGEGFVPGIDEKAKMVTLRLVPVEIEKGSDVDRLGTGKAGVFEHPFPPDAIAKFDLKFGTRIDIVLQKP